MLSLKDFNTVRVTNISSVSGGWHYTTLDGVKSGDARDRDGAFYELQSDGTYRKDP